MHIWLISAFEPTPLDNTRPMRFMGIADAALQRGHRITFYTTTFKHNTKSYRFDRTTSKTIEKNRYNIVFVHSKPYHKNISWSRIMAHYDLGQKLLHEVKQENDKPDIIFISLPPLSTVDNICQWGKENNIPVIVDIIDPWPDVFLKIVPTPLQGLARIPLSPFYLKLKRIMKNCTGITAISKQYVEWAKAYCSNGKAAAFFYPSVQFDEVKAAFNKLQVTLEKDNSKLRIIYAGSLSSSYDIPTILTAAEILEQKHPDRTEFAIAGTGPQESLIKEKGLKNVKYLGWLGQDEMYKEFYLSHLGLTQHIAGATQSVTYKLFDYLSAGLPILNSLDSEMADIISENKVGFNNRSGDAGELASNIERFINNKEMLASYRENALLLTAKIGDSKTVYASLIEFIEECKRGNTVCV
ncbi:MAG: glycosyltransferase family 4 protein [Flavisolibacter sp.]|nr:glycosyltransferase family 4 protein [Flavisolibacter sp.]